MPIDSSTLSIHYGSFANIILPPPLPPIHPRQLSGNGVLAGGTDKGQVVQVNNRTILKGLMVLCMQCNFD